VKVSVLNRVKAKAGGGGGGGFCCGLPELQLETNSEALCSKNNIKKTSSLALPRHPVIFHLRVERDVKAVDNGGQGKFTGRDMRSNFSGLPSA
jgi:hypothetical protein